MATTANKSGLREKKYRIGDRVKFLYSDWIQEAPIVEVHGPIGHGGRRLYRMEWPGSSDEPHAIALSADYFLVDQGPIDLGGIHLAGPYSEAAKLPAEAGVYAVLDNRNGNRVLIDVGYAKDVRQRVQEHDRKDCWERSARGKLEFAVYCTPEDALDQRQIMEDWLRAKFAPPCGQPQQLRWQREEEY